MSEPCCETRRGKKDAWGVFLGGEQVYLPFANRPYPRWIHRSRSPWSFVLDFGRARCLRRDSTSAYPLLPPDGRVGVALCNPCLFVSGRLIRPSSSMAVRVKVSKRSQVCPRVDCVLQKSVGGVRPRVVSLVTLGNHRGPSSSSTKSEKASSDGSWRPSQGITQNPLTGAPYRWKVLWIGSSPYPSRGGTEKTISAPCREGYRQNA